MIRMGTVRGKMTGFSYRAPFLSLRDILPPMGAGHTCQHLTTLPPLGDTQRSGGPRSVSGASAPKGACKGLLSDASEQVSQLHQLSLEVLIPKDISLFHVYFTGHY